MPSVDATKKLVSSFVLSGLLQLFTGQSPGSPAESTTQCSSSCPWQTRARPRKAFAQIPPLVASLILDWVQNSTLCYRSRDSSGPASGLLSINLPALCILQTLDSWHQTQVWKACFKSHAYDLWPWFPSPNLYVMLQVFSLSNPVWKRPSSKTAVLRTFTVRPTRVLGKTDSLSCI